MRNEKHIQINESLAFALAETNGITLEEWQDDAGHRASFRRQAELLGTKLEAGGMRIAVSNSKEMDKKMEFILTRQPRPAYDLSVDIEPEEKLPDTEAAPREDEINPSSHQQPCTQQSIN